VSVKSHTKSKVSDPPSALQGFEELRFRNAITSEIAILCQLLPQVHPFTVPL